MSAPSKPTPAQLTALRLAARAAICVELHFARHAATGAWRPRGTTLNTIRACMARGWLSEQNKAVARRWTITDAGRVALATAEEKY